MFPVRWITPCSRRIKRGPPRCSLQDVRFGTALANHIPKHGPCTEPPRPHINVHCLPTQHSQRPLFLSPHGWSLLHHIHSLCTCFNRVPHCGLSLRMSFAVGQSFRKGIMIWVWGTCADDFLERNNGVIVFGRGEGNVSTVLPILMFTFYRFFLPSAHII